MGRVSEWLEFVEKKSRLTVLVSDFLSRDALSTKEEA